MLEQMKPEEQDCLLRVMNRLKEEQMSLSVFIAYPYIEPTDKLLNLLIRLQSIDRSNLLGLLDSMGLQEQKELISIMGDLEVSEQVELLGILGELEALEQQILLNVLNRTYCCSESSCAIYLNMYLIIIIPHTETTVLKLMKSLLPVDWSRLLRILDGLDSTSRRRLLTVLEHSHELLETMDKLRLLRMLNRVDSQVMVSKIIDKILDTPLRISEIIDSVELQRQQLELVLDILGYPLKYNTMKYVMTHSVHDLNSVDAR